MALINDLLSNEILISSLLAWVLAQILKTIVDTLMTKSFSPERLVGSGGMPSSHSSIVCALTMSCALVYGLSSFQVAISFVVAAVVMYDAMGVRRETGKQAKLLNLILEQDIFDLDPDQFQETLKELIGHTPLQVVVGAILGISVSMVMHMFY